MRHRFLALAICITFAGLSFLPSGTQSQSKSKSNSNLNTYNGCPMEGSTKTKCLQAINKLKNRWASAPSDGEINEDITLKAILASGDDENRWKTDNGAEVTGYVRKVTGTGAESCNCGSTEQAFQDIHIDLVASETIADGNNPECKSFVVEITPRWKKIKGWKLKDIKKLEGKWVKFRGWMFFDRYHLKESTNTRNSSSFTCKGPTSEHTCGAEKNEIWRASAWEIHPVTSFQIVSQP